MPITIHKQTIQFLKELKKHNDRDWFHANKEKYDAAKENFHEFVQVLIKKIAQFEPALAEINAKDCIFRINRDIRFAKDKSPYKINFGALLSGKANLHKSAYYLHLEPNQSFISAGIYMPDAKTLKAIRQEIVYNGEAFLKIIENKNFKKYFILDNEKLVNVPQGFDKNHPLAELLKCKQMIALHSIESDEEVLSEKYSDYCTTVFKMLQPFNKFLNEAISDIEKE